MKKIGLIVTSLVVGLVCFGDTQGQAAKLVTVATPYRQSRLQHLHHVKKVAKKKTVSLDIVLKPRQTKTLSQLALAVNTTDSQSFKGYLTPQQFRAKFGQSSATTSRLTRYFRARHLQATAANNGLLIRVKGHVATINKAFAVNLKTARYHGKKIQFSKQTPRLPKQVAQPIRAVVGVTNLMIAKSLTTKSPAQVKHLTAKRSPTKFLKQYHASNLATSGQQGAGQTVGIISFGHVPTAAIKHFWRQAGVPTTGRLETKTTGGATVMDNGDDSDDETALDAEQAGTILSKGRGERVQPPNITELGRINPNLRSGRNRASLFGIQCRFIITIVSIVHDRSAT
ncbi:protease pro-enzyme activation domain-containing protein, partial [Levilactobacillus brevis]|uniref:protease pro-enzyme activation domain-containing protein n=1 Tax=Levilactobacillus brevis TaxID=1580 RepID=UPI00201221BD